LPFIIVKKLFSLSLMERPNKLEHWSLASLTTLV
jgi:hypothetical protein